MGLTEHLMGEAKQVVILEGQVLRVAVSVAHEAIGLDKNVDEALG